MMKRFSPTRIILRGSDSNSFAPGCQRFLIWLFLASVPGVSPAAGTPGSAPGAQAAAPPVEEPRIRDWRFGGSFSLNWRNVGPRKPGYETQIQNEVYLADLYFDVYGPVIDGVPFLMEYNIPTGSQGQPSLYRFQFNYDRFEDWDLVFGKFLVPFGRYNELYRPDMFLTVTRPLLYASPDSLDLVVRINSPRPPFSSGYTDIGSRVTYYPPDHLPFVPREMTGFVVNGLGESSNRSRTFPRPEHLGIPPPPANGQSVDFGHENNNLADNNNNKAVGGRMIFALGDLDFPWPIPEGKRDLSGISLGLSAMGGQYNLEAELNYHMLGADVSFEYQGANITAEYMYGFTHFRSPLEAAPSSTTLLSPTAFVRDFETLSGYYLQASLPLMRRPPWGKRLSGVLVFNRLFRRGPQLDLLTNQTIAGTLYPSIAAYNPAASRVDTRMDKYTLGLNYQLSEHFSTKFDYSYWVMGRGATDEGVTDIYQGAFSIIMTF